MNEGKSVNTNIVKMPKKIQYTPYREIIPDIPQDIIYPNELNNFLREQLRYHVQKSGLLQQNLNDLEVRYMNSKDNIKKLEEKLNDYEKIYDNAKSSQVASSKIIELSKKLREKTLEIETLKARCSKAETCAFNLKQQLEDEQLISVKECNTHETPTDNLPKEENKRQTEKIETLNIKLSECNNLILLLKNELKLAKKIIQQETGENFEVLQKLNNSNGWRGRAQHIIDLQQKNSELKEKLRTSQGSNPTELVSFASKNDAQLSTLTKEIEQLKSKNEELKKKHDALKARYKVADMDVTLLKSKSTMLKEQATRDQEVISSLLGQLNSSKEMKNDLILQKERSITKLQAEKKQFVLEIEEYKSVIKSLREELKEKGAELEKKAKLNNLDKSEELIKVSEPMDRYNNLLELIETGNEKLKCEREAHIKTQTMLKIEKQKVVKSESALARMGLENSTRQSYSSISSVRSLDPTLKDQLELAEEKIKALQTRLEIEQMERKEDLKQFGQIIKTYETPATNT
ncbi:unnamed protein product [Diabrotica balteata]|uniref:Coiled-coil domain-containing protein 13 n=1 Tax=Diabrotica balteata TaxID=107213 RepID=A0A9N9XB97_DIABA|nr:unnamed protein product [Diabrotica balteata]